MNAFLTAAQLEQLMVKTWGPHFREKVIVGPVGSFRLGDAFEECGLVDPRAPVAENPSSGFPALWQMAPIPLPLAPLSPAQQVRWMARYIAERYPSHRKWEAFRTAAWARFASGGRWPVSPAPRSPHGDPLMR